MQNQDPILKALEEINGKQDRLLQNQERMDAEIKKIHADCRRTSAATGAAAGAVTGGIVATGIAFARAKLGL